MKRLILTLIISMGLAGAAHAQMLALKTDATADALFIPNVNAELVTSNKTSANISLLYAYHPAFTNMRALAVMPEFRYWFGGRPLTRWFCGASVVGASYKSYREHKFNGDGSLKSLGRTNKGDVWGMGLTFGYVFSLGKSNRWGMEVTAGVGAYHYRQLNRYPEYYMDSKGNWHLESGYGHSIRQDDFTEKGWVILPYKLGVSFSYILPTQGRKKKLTEE